MADPSSALVRGVLEPLSALGRTGRLGQDLDVAVVLVDGLCDAEKHRFFLKKIFILENNIVLRRFIINNFFSLLFLLLLLLLLIVISEK